MEVEDWDPAWDDHHIYDHYLSETACTLTFRNGRVDFNDIAFTLKTDDP